MKHEEILIELAKLVMLHFQENIPEWKRGYIRFSISDSKHGSNGSYEIPVGIKLIDPFVSKGLFNMVNSLCCKLSELSEKPFKVLLLSIKSDFSYEYSFEYENEERWKITKLNGSSGLPEGIN